MSQPKKEKDHAGTILIVDDEPTVRELLESILREEGYCTDFAENGHDGYEKARKLIPNLILLDVTMPVMDGFEACRKIKTEPPLARVPIIMITAVSDDQSRMRSIQSGADYVIGKPFDMEELISQVRNITKDNCLRELSPESESPQVAHEEFRDAYHAPVEEWESVPESRGTENKEDSPRDTGFRSIADRASGEPLSSGPVAGKSPSRFWKKS